MEINESLLTKEDWLKLKETADQIVKNSTRDLILWGAVSRECESYIIKLENVEADEVLREIAQA